MNLVIVSGRSGSGKSVALRALEDLGYYCVDNLPVSLIGTLMHQLKPSYESVAISIDIRNLKDQIRELDYQLAAIAQEVKLTSFYLHSNDSVLLKRYSETRRLHPLSQQQSSLPEALKLEGELLEPFAKQVDHYIDTSTMNIYELSDKVREILLGYTEKELVITFESFGFKHGMPEQADFMFDVRFLPNPHWEEGLRSLTGLDEPVQDFFGKHPMVSKLIWQVENMMATWLPYLERNNRSYLTIAIGCTGGQHRSVFVAEQLALYFKDSRHTIKTHHRELARAS